MSKKTAAALAMDEVARRVAPLLTDAGFTKRRRAFNRATEPGVVQVISFQLSYAHSGRFTLNLGIYVEALRAQFSPWMLVSGWVNEYDCQLRKRIGQLLPGTGDTWWQVDDIDAAVATVRTALTTYGLPWLEQRRAQTDILVDTYSVRQTGTPVDSLDATCCASEEEAQRFVQRVLAVARARPGFTLHNETPVSDAGEEAVLVHVHAEDAATLLPDVHTLVAREGRLVLRYQVQHQVDNGRLWDLSGTARFQLRQIQRRYVARGRTYPSPITFPEDGAPVVS